MISTVSTALFGAHISPDQALDRLRVDRSYSQSIKGKRASLRFDSTIGNLYVFSTDNGYVILPSEDFSPALLAYSDKAPFDISGNPGLRYWLKFYNEEIEAAKRRHSVRQSPVNSCSDNLNKSQTILREKRVDVEPLLRTEWNQEYPYNELCPKVDGRETVTGCVATAMAQVMKFHNFPDHGKGTHSYFWRPGEEELSFNYESISFKWNLMDDIYDSKSSEESRHAVAELMLGCGVSIDMHYEPGESGASTSAMGQSLIDIFGYSPSLWMPDRAFYGYDEWEGMIYADLALGLPVLYSGAGTAGGHQFICDGYREDGFFHFNWGWGGLSNGYFRLTALNPDDLGVGGGAGGFNTSQIATLGVRPANGDDKPVYIVYNTIGFRSFADKIKVDEDVRFSGEYYNYSLATLPDDTKLGVKIVSESDGMVRYVDGPGMGGLHLDDGRLDLQIRFPEMPSGAYKLTPALHVDGKWETVRMPVGYPAVITATVNDDEVSFNNEEAATVRISDIDIPEPIYRDREFPMQFTVSNTGDLEFYESITPYLADSSGKIVAESDFRPVDVLPGAIQRIGDYKGCFRALKDEEFPAGEYGLVFKDRVSGAVSDTIKVKVEINDDKTVIKVSDFHLIVSENLSDPDDVKFGYTLKCESGLFFGKLRVDVFPGDGGYELCHADSDEIYIAAGEERDLELTADLSELKEGAYMAAIYDGSESLSNYISFRIKRTTTGLEVTNDKSSSAEIYDLYGRTVNGNLSKGVYIINGKKILIQ